MTQIPPSAQFADIAPSVRIARLLSLTDADRISDVALARAVGEGLKPSAHAALIAWFDGAKPVVQVIPEATLRRARTQSRPLSRDHSERLYELSRVADAALQAYGGDADRARDFLTRPHPLLEGERPLDLACLSSAGADAVVAQIARAMAGVAV